MPVSGSQIIRHSAWVLEAEKGKLLKGRGGHLRDETLPCLQGPRALLKWHAGSRFAYQETRVVCAGRTQPPNGSLVSHRAAAEEHVQDSGSDLRAGESKYCGAPHAIAMYFPCILIFPLEPPGCETLAARRPVGRAFRCTGTAGQGFCQGRPARKLLSNTVRALYCQGGSCCQRGKALRAYIAGRFRCT